jgi:superfamily II DNA or RNA helicase
MQMTGSPDLSGYKPKGHYRSGRDDLARDFFAPSMSAASRYRRAAGYFSSTALLGWIDGLPRVALQKLSIQLISSPIISEADRQTLVSLEDHEQLAAHRAILVDRILEEIVTLAISPGDVAARARVFAWLVANDRLELKFAFPAHVSEPGIFHEKFGVFDLESGGRIAFTGSANETSGGHSRNYESIDVYCDWIAADRDRVQTKVEQFDETWAGEATGLAIVSPSRSVLQQLREVASVPVGAPEATEEHKPEPTDTRWRHQDEAVQAFMESPAGILEMATGTGKTKTAIKILDRLVAQKAIRCAIVTVEGTDLLEQWSGELDAWNLNRRENWLIYRHFGRYHELGDFVVDPENALIVISRGQLSKLLRRMPDAMKSKAFIIHDEVHGLGTASLISGLAGEHKGFGWRIGLSATPDRAYDAEGNDFIGRELGPTLYRFPLESAIERGILSEFDYRPLAYDLTDNDRERLRLVYAKKAARQRQGSPMSNEEVWTEIAKVYKTAEEKPDVFEKHLQMAPELLDRSIVFVETIEYGERILESIHRRTHRYRTYYADDDRDHLIAFARGDIDCLITCHRISQGIDIRSLNTVVLFASARAKLETIQRIGRCLRIEPANPRKRALVVDFVRPGEEGDAVPNADQDRCAWLAELANVRRKQDGN